MHRKRSRSRSCSGAANSGRKVDREGRRDHLERRKKQIEAQIASINARNEVDRRKRETRANIIIGAVIRAHAALHAAFMPMLADILTVGLRRQADRQLLAEVLGLPQLAVGGEAAETREPGGEPDDAGIAAKVPPRLSRLAECAAEITAWL